MANGDVINSMLDGYTPESPDGRKILDVLKVIASQQRCDIHSARISRNEKVIYMIIGMGVLVTSAMPVIMYFISKGQ